jgi:GNAT superfamily N-acetyltransferase
VLAGQRGAGEDHYGLGVSVRRATEADLPVLDTMWRAFAREIPPPAYAPSNERAELEEMREIVASGLGFVYEGEGRIAGLALSRTKQHGLATLTDLYVAPASRRSGVAAALVAAVADAARRAGASHLQLEVSAPNADARVVYHRWGFREHAVTLVAPVGELQDRLSPGRHSVSFGSIHVQNDDRGWVEKTAAEFAPRIGSPGSRVEGPRNGWTTVYDPVIDADPNAMLRYARELSELMGAVVVALALEVDQVVRLIALDRGGIVDEYLSVPEFYGPLPPGDVIGLAANPTVLARLTGADPSIVKAIARTAPTPAELPPAPELLDAIARALGLEGAEHGFARDVGEG